MKELTYRFQNPHNSCEEVHYCSETKQHYILMPFTPYSQQLCTCTPSRGYYEADCPVRGGLTYKINGQVVTTEEDGEIVDYAKKEAYENKEYSFYRVKPEYASLPNYEWLAGGRMVQQLFDYMVPEHFEQVTYKRKDVYCIMGGWYKKEEDIIIDPDKELTVVSIGNNVKGKLVDEVLADAMFRRGELSNDAAGKTILDFGK